MPATKGRETRCIGILGSGLMGGKLGTCGDDESSKEIAAGLIQDVGFDRVEAGPLRIARYIEPFALLVAELAYEGEGGPELAYRFERFEK
jgi:predicted dinucleotide-binding enzyme